MPPIDANAAARFGTPAALAACGTTPDAATEPALPLNRDGEGERFPARFGRYRVLRVLGQGGMGTVYEQEQDQPHRRVALKTLRAELGDEQAHPRFARESEALGRLQHPGIAQIYDAGTAIVRIATRVVTACGATSPSSAGALVSTGVIGPDSPHVSSHPPHTRVRRRGGRRSRAGTESRRSRYGRRLTSDASQNSSVHVAERRAPNAFR